MSTPIVPAAPGRLSTMTCCPQRSVSFAATARAVMSVPPPGTKGPMRRTGFVGYLSTSADAAYAMGTLAHTVSASTAFLRLRPEIMRPPPFAAAILTLSPPTSHLRRHADCIQRVSGSAGNRFSKGRTMPRQTKTRGAAKSSAGPWWHHHGDDDCPHCDQSYSYRVEARCFECDAPICPMCIVRVDQRMLCPDCHKSGETR